MCDQGCLMSIQKILDNSFIRHYNWSTVFNIYDLNGDDVFTFNESYIKTCKSLKTPPYHVKMFK